MKVKQLVAIICLGGFLFVAYQSLQKPKTNHSKEMTSHQVRKSSHDKKQGQQLKVNQEAKNTLEASDKPVSQEILEKVRQDIGIPINALMTAKSQEDIEVTYDTKLSITSIDLAQTIKTMLMAGYHFDKDSLEVYHSHVSNVYQLTINLVTDKNDSLSVTGNYVIGTGQFEFVVVHGTPVNIVY